MLRRCCPPTGMGTATPPRKSGLVVFCAEHGFCGGFNGHPLRASEMAIEQNRESVMLIAVGSRGGQICREHGLRPDLVLPMAAHCAGVTAAARRVAAELYRMFSTNQVGSVEVIYTQQAGTPFAHVEHHRLLPLEVPVADRRWERVRPIINVSPRRLFDDMMGEYFFATLENAAMQSFFSENSTRFRAMEAAYRNIQNKSADLIAVSRRLRQEAVTTEILDLISGSEALSSRLNSSR